MLDFISQSLRELRPIAKPITVETHIFTDLNFDSLSFIALLIQVEEEYNISFAITEIEQCLIIGPLIELIEEKRGVDHD